MQANGTRVKFETEGPSWAERATRGELTAVLSPDGSERRNVFLHTLSLYAARKALGQRKIPGVLLDFGCGTGRMLRFFAARGWSVIGTEITWQMLMEARRFGLPPSTAVLLTDGVAIPLSDASVDIIWVCGVLKYTLFAPGAVCRGGSRNATDASSAGDAPFMPVYYEVAREMYRVLKPGGCVVNNEVYVDAEPEAFTRDFERNGFVTEGRSRAAALFRALRQITSVAAGSALVRQERRPSLCLPAFSHGRSGTEIAGHTRLSVYLAQARALSGERDAFLEPRVCGSDLALDGGRISTPCDSRERLR